MTPLQPFKASDFSKLYTPKPLPPVVPITGGVSPTTAGKNDNTLTYVGLAVLFIFVVGSSVYLIWLSDRILNEIGQIKESNERIMLASHVTNSETPKPSDKKLPDSETNTPGRPSA